MSLRDWFRQRPMVAPEPNPEPLSSDPTPAANAAFDTLPIATDQRRLGAPDATAEPIYAAMLARRGDFVQLGRLNGQQLPLLLDFIHMHQASDAAFDLALAGWLDDTEGGEHR